MMLGAACSTKFVTDILDVKEKWKIFWLEVGRICAPMVPSSMGCQKQSLGRDLRRP